MTRSAGLLAAVALSACATSQAWTPPAAQDRRDDPEAMRPGHGNRELGTWWPLTTPEVAALGQLAEARLGDAHALLALAVLASGDRRDAAGYASARERVDRFVAEMGPVMAAAPDEWHRGYELNRAMHRAFFGGERGELGSYDFAQAHLTGIFAGGRYNCLSSAVLFAVLARAFDLPVRAAVVPTHVFIEMGAPGGKVIEVETTSATGFDWVHDERFFREAAVQWSGARGLRPVTLDEYQHRTIVEPYQLMARAMRDARAGAGPADRPRLLELAALVDPDDEQAVHDRVQVYVNESIELYEAKAWRTTVKLFDTVAPALARTNAATRWATTRELVSWASWSYAHALLIVGRSDEAMARVDDGLDHLDAGWHDAGKLAVDYLGVLAQRVGELIASSQYAAALAAMERHRDACRSNDVCAGNMGIVYADWSIQHQNAGDWQAARQVLRDCVAALPSDARCRDALADLESRHRF